MIKKIKTLICIFLVLLLGTSAIPVSAGQPIADVLDGETPAFRTTPKIAAGGVHAMALDDRGIVWAWGSNAIYLSGGHPIPGTLGVGSTDEAVAIPTQVIDLSEVVDIAVGWGTSFALRADGTVWWWGWQLGVTFGLRTTPTQVPNLENIVAIAAGEFHAIALKSDGTVWAWGGNSHGQLGDGTTSDRSNPVQVHGLDNVVDIAAGTYMRCVVRRGHSLAIRADGTVWAWGSNDGGQLGDGTTIDRHTPVQVQNMNNVTAVAAGNSHSLALRSDGTVWGWGRNNEGQLGIQLLSQDEMYQLWRQDRNTPIPYLQFLTPVQNPGIRNATAISAHTAGSMALLADGSVWAWGRPLWFSGRPGAENTLGMSSDPIQIKGLNNITAISINSRSFAIRNDETVWGWGDNFLGRLGTLVEPPNGLTPLPLASPCGTGFLNLGQPSLPAPSPTPTPTPTPIPTPAQPTITATIRFNANGGSGAPADIIIQADAEGSARVNIPAAIPTRDGHTFGGWGLFSWHEGITTNGMDWFVPGRTVFFDRALENGDLILLYAHWHPIRSGTPPVLSPLSYRGSDNNRLRDGVIGQDYWDFIVTTAGTAPITWSITSGALPNGIAMPNNITISTVNGLPAFRVYGTPTTAGTFHFTIRAENGAGFYELPFTFVVHAEPPPPPPVNQDELERRIFEMVNEERAHHGLRPLIWDDSLARAARLHSQDLADNRIFGHTGSDGSDPSQRARRAGFNGAVGENVVSSGVPEIAMLLWMDSPGHRENILNPRYTHIGVGVGVRNGAASMGTIKFGIAR